MTLAATTNAGGAATSESVPILEVIKMYGKLAGPSCFGRTAPKGSSCQVTRDEDWLRKRQQAATTTNIKAAAPMPTTPKDLQTWLNEELEFAWPLKPYGVEKSNDKTAIMNKGAETRLYMDQLTARGLYDARNPTGPLPTSLRPALNHILQQEGVSEAAATLLLERITSGPSSPNMMENLFQGRNAIDYYDFLEFLGKNSISWDY